MDLPIWKLIRPYRLAWRGSNKAVTLSLNWHWSGSQRIGSNSAMPMVEGSLPFVFAIFLQSLLHSPRALLSRYRRWLNKVSNLKIHRWFCSHCLVTWLLRLRYITGQFGPENNLWFSINSPGRAVSCYLRAGRAEKVLARAISNA